MQVGYLTGVVTVAVVESLCLVLRMAGNSWEENKKTKEILTSWKDYNFCIPLCAELRNGISPTYLPLM